MPLDFQIINLPLRFGVDQKSDPRAIEPQQLLTCDNAVFDEVGGMQKRPGTLSMGLSKAAGGTIDVARTRGLGVRGEDLVLFAEGKAWAWSDKDSKWHDRGRCEQFLLDQRTVMFDRSDQTMADRAELNGIIVYAWEDGRAGGVRWACVDKVTRAVMTSASTPFVTSAKRPRCLALNGRLHVYYFDDAASPKAIKCDVIDPADVYNTLGASLVTVANATNEVSGPFDVMKYDTTTALIAYVTNASPKDVKLRKLDKNAATVGSTVTVARACDLAVAIDYNSSAGDLVSLLRLDDAGNTIKVDFLTGSTLADSATVDVTVHNVGVTGKVFNITTSMVVSGGNNYAYCIWDQQGTTSATEATNDSVKRRVIQSNGTRSTIRSLARRSRLGSRVLRWTDNTVARNMVHVVHSGAKNSLQSCYVLLDADFVAGDSDDEQSGTSGLVESGVEMGLLAYLFPGEGPGEGASGAALFRVGHLPQIEDVGSNKYACALPFRRFWEGGTVKHYHERGIRDVVYTAFDSRAFLGREEGKALYLPGAYVAEYDGKRVVENGFWIYPEDVKTTTSTLDGFMANNTGKYTYRVYWEWKNASGEIERSTALTVTTAAMPGGTSTQSVLLTIPTLPYTNKENVYAVIYRAEVDKSAIFYRVVGFDPAITVATSTAPSIATLNDIKKNAVTYRDTMSDTQLVTKEQDYLSAGELDNIAPRATPFVTSGQARLFVRDPEDPHLVRFSKIRLDGDAVMFNDGLTMRVPEDGGAVTAVEITEGALIIFAEKATYVATGQGPTNTNGPPDYTAPQRVADIGCTDPRSVVRTPRGIFFQSKKGIYLLPHTPGAGGVEYIGAPVEDAMTGFTVVGAINMPDKHQARFYVDASFLVYDYLVGQWSVWKNGAVFGTAKHMVLWGDTPVHLDGTAPYRPQATFADGTTGYSLSAKMRVKFAGLQGYKRVRRLMVLGEYRAAHDLRVQLAYNYSASVTDTFTFVLTADPAPYQLRVTPTRQQIEAIDVTLTDLTPGGGGTWRESMKLTGLAFQVGLKPGLMRLPAAGLK